MALSDAQPTHTQPLDITAPKEAGATELIASRSVPDPRSHDTTGQFEPRGGMSPHSRAT